MVVWLMQIMTMEGHGPREDSLSTRPIVLSLPCQGVVRQEAEGSETDGDAVTNLESRRAGFRFRTSRHDRHTDHSFRSVDGYFVQRRQVAALRPVREIKSHIQFFISSNKVNLFNARLANKAQRSKHKDRFLISNPKIVSNRCPIRINRLD